MAAQHSTSTLPTTPVSLPISRPRRGAISISYGSDEHHHFLTQLHLPVPLAAAMHVPDLSDLAIAITDVVDPVDCSSSSNADGSDEDSPDSHDNAVSLSALSTSVPRNGLLTRRRLSSKSKNSKVAPLSLVVALPKPQGSGGSIAKSTSASSRSGAAHAI